MSVLRDSERACPAPDDADIGDVCAIPPIPFAVGERRCGNMDKPRVIRHFHKRLVVEIRRLADLERVTGGAGGGQPAERRRIHRDDFVVCRRIGEVLPEDRLAVDADKRRDKLPVLGDRLMADGREGSVVPMGLAWRKPVVELQFHLNGIRRGDEQQAMDMRPVVHDGKELLLQQDFLFIGVEPMDAEAWACIVRGFHFRRATVPCGNENGDTVLRQRLALRPCFPLLVGVAVANGEFVSCMPAEGSDIERTACAEIVSRPTDEGVVLHVFETGVFKDFGGQG